MVAGQISRIFQTCKHTVATSLKSSVSHVFNLMPLYFTTNYAKVNAVAKPAFLLAHHYTFTLGFAFFLVSVYLLSVLFV